MAVSPSDVLAHIRNTLHKDMKNKPKINDYVARLHGALSVDAPLPPPIIMFAHYFQLNAKYGMSLPRDIEFFNGLPGGKQWQLIYKYLRCICGLQERDLPAFK